MIRSLPSVLLASLVYVLVYLVVSARVLLRRVDDRVAAGAGDFLEAVPVPAWWVVLLVLPPALLLIWWAVRRRTG